jgi:hypothetical protein
MCMLAVLFVASGIAQSVWHQGWIGADPVMATGRITNLVCHNHGFVDFAFETDGITHDATDHFGNGIPCQSVKIGDPIAVYYEKGAPDNNYGVYPVDTPGNPARQAFLGGLAMFGALIFLGPFFSPGFG